MQRGERVGHSRARQCSCTGVGLGGPAQGSCRRRRESWVPRGKEESQPLREGGLRLLSSPPSWESIPRKLTSQGCGAKTSHGSLRLGLQRCSAPRSHQVLGLLSLMAPVSSLPSPRKPPLFPLQPAGKWRHRSVGRMKGAWGREGRAGSSCLGNPLCSDLLAGSQMLSPAYGGNVHPAEGGGGPWTGSSSLPVGTCVCLH